MNEFSPQEGIMGELQLEGDELKKLVKLSRKKALPFAFSPDKGETPPMFCIHRRKKPEALGKALRKESGQNKIGFGTLALEGKTLNMTCARVVAGMSKKLKKFLRSQKLPLNVVLLDLNGVEIDG
jgi:hypothetical protein